MNERRKNRWRPRARALTVLTMVASAVAACAPAERADGPRAVLADGASASARVITVVHALQPGAVIAGVGYADTTTAPVVVNDGSAAVDLNALLLKPPTTNPGDIRLYSTARSRGVAALEVARDGRHARRQGRWTREARLDDGRVARFEFEATGGGPVSQVTLRVNGETVSTETRHWARSAEGVWTLASRTLTLFQKGRATGWIETRVEVAPLRTASAAERVEMGAASVLRAGARAAADALAPAPLFAQAMTGPCGPQANATLDALKDYESSVALLGSAMLSANPFATVAAGVNVLRTATKVDDAEARLDACVAAA
jgi:hypothetical protein